MFIHLIPIELTKTKTKSDSCNSLYKRNWEMTSNIRLKRIKLIRKKQTHNIGHYPTRCNVTFDWNQFFFHFHSHLNLFIVNISPMLLLCCCWDAGNIIPFRIIQLNNNNNNNKAEKQTRFSFKNEKVFFFLLIFLVSLIWPKQKH